MTARRPSTTRLADMPAVPSRSGVRALLDSAEVVALRAGGVAVVDAELVLTANEWAEVIKADLSTAVQGIVAAGQHLTRAKADVRHGEWLPMLKQIGISQSAAKRLMSIAANPAIANRPTLGDLPSSIVALAELARLPADEIESGIAEGSITSDLTITKAKALVDPTPEPVADEPIPYATAEAAAIAELDAADEADETPGPEHRRCVECGNWFPLDLMWPPTANSSGGYDYVCQECGTDESASYVPPATPASAAPQPTVVQQKTRQPLALQAQNAGLDLQRAIRRIERLFNDANNAQRKKLAPELTSLLNTAITNCQLTIQHIEHPGEVFIDTVGADS